MDEFRNSIFDASNNSATSNPKGVLIVNTIAGHGGAARAAYDMLCVGMRRLGFLTYMICAESKVLDDAKVAVLRKNHSWWQVVRKNYYRWFGLLDLHHDSDNLLAHDFFQEADVLHLHNLHGDYINPKVLPLLTSRKPTIWTLHDEQSFTGHCAYSFSCERWHSGCGSCPALSYYPSLRRDSTGYLWRLKKTIYDESDFTVVVPSQWLKERVSRSMLGAKDIRLIYNGIDEEVWRPIDKRAARKRLGLPLDKKILLFLADGSVHNPQKGGGYVLRAIEKMTCLEDVLFLVVGHDGELDYPNVMTRGYVYDKARLVEYYSAADLFIFPTMADNLPFVVLEAMACALPVVSFHVGGVPEEIDHMNSGYLAKYLDFDDFMRGINLFLADEALRRRASIAARDRFLEKFTQKKCLEKYADLYREVYAKRQAH
ncbi:MAG: glycosyltransferase [Candidatus Moranbacteria bacterium]|nr:glycosyltransferase [Candidatus Moranbacteria bacterium]